MFPEINIFDRYFDTYTVYAWSAIIIMSAAILIFRPKEFRPVKYVVWGIILAIFFSFVGANLLNIIIKISQHPGQDMQKAIKTSGSAYLGALVAAILTLWIYCKKIGLSFLAIADYAAPFFMLERFIGRLGCLGYGCCHGIPSNLPWAQVFNVYPNYDLKFRHPTQLYALICTLAIFVSSRYLYKKLRVVFGPPNEQVVRYRFYRISIQDFREAKPFGVTFFYVILFYSFFRFLNEFLRAEGPIIYGVIHLTHPVLFGSAVIAAIGLFRIIKRSGESSLILQVLKSAVIRLLVWLVLGGVVGLSILSYYSFSMEELPGEI